MNIFIIKKPTTAKIAVITGSSKGIGRAIALTFAKSKNYSGTVTNGRYQNEVEAVSQEIRSIGCDCIAIQADISKEEDFVRLIREAVEHIGRINSGKRDSIIITDEFKTTMK